MKPIPPRRLDYLLKQPAVEVLNDHFADSITERIKNTFLRLLQSKGIGTFSEFVSILLVNPRAFETDLPIGLTNSRIVRAVEEITGFEISEGAAR